MKNSYKGEQTMNSKRGIIRSLVCTTLACSFATCALAADKDNGETVQSSWMDRTDIGVAVQSTQKDNYHEYKINPTPYRNTDSAITRSEHSSTQEMKKAQYFIETIQPIKYYGEHAKSVLFIQGRIDGNGGEKISSDAYWNGGESSYIGDDPKYKAAARLAQQPSYLDKGETVQHDSLGIVGSIGAGYRRLSKNEHAYMGINTFYDYAFRDKLSRVGIGLEYVAGLNKISANVYHGLSEKKTKPYYFENSLVIVPRADEFHYPEDGHPNGFTKIRYAYENVLDGYNVRYTRDYKNARWISTYVDGYHWKTKSLREHPVDMFYLNQHKWKSISGLKLGATLNITPHISIDLGFNKNNISSGEPYVSVMYTLGKSKYAYLGGKHSENTVSTARSKMLDKVKRHDLVVESYSEYNYRDTPWDHL